MPASKRGPMGRPPKISRELVLDTVLRIGFEKATVSEVARALEVDQSALYRHVTSRDLMLRDAAERAFERYRWPTEGAQWRAYLEEFADSLWDFLSSVPGLGLYLASTRHVPKAMTATALGVTARLCSFGFAPRDAMLVVDSVADMITQSLIMQRTLDAPAGARPASGADDSLRARAIAAVQAAVPELEDAIGFVTIMTSVLASPPDDTAWWRAKLELLLDGAAVLLGETPARPPTAGTEGAPM